MDPPIGALQNSSFCLVILHHSFFSSYIPLPWTRLAAPGVQKKKKIKSFYEFL